MSLDLDAAWIAVSSPDELPAEVADEIGDVSNRIGLLPNVARLLAATLLISRLHRQCLWEVS